MIDYFLGLSHDKCNYLILLSLVYRTMHISLGSKSVKKVLNGAGGLSSDLIKNAIEMFPRAKLLSAYGMLVL